MITGSNSSNSGESRSDSVAFALDLLMEEIDRENDCVKRAGANAFQNGEYGWAKASLGAVGDPDGILRKGGCAA